MNMVIKTNKFEPETHFTSLAAQRELLKDALATGDAGYIADALGVIARARGMTETAQSASGSPMALYKGPDERE